MKTNKLWRRMLIGVSFVLAMVLALAGCGKSGPTEADYIGYWEVSGGTLYGEEYDAEMLQMMKDWGMVIVIHLNKDGKAELDLFGEVVDGTWDLKDKRMTFEGDTLEFKLENDTLYIVEGDDNLTFTRGNSADLAAAIETDRNSASTGGFGTEDPAGGTYEPVTIPVDPPIVVANDGVVTASIIEKATESTGETVALTRAVDDYVRKIVAKGVEVNGERDIAVCIHSLGYDVREERGNLRYVLLREIGGGLPADPVHLSLLVT